MSVWGKVREFALRDVGGTPPGRELVKQAVIEVVGGLVIIAATLALLDYRDPDPMGLMWCLLGLGTIAKGIYDFAQ